MRARRLTAAGMLTAAAFSTTVGGIAITGSLDKAFAASPVSPPVSHQNPGQNGQNGNQSGTGQNPGQNGQNTTTTTTPPPPPPGLPLADLNTQVEGTVNGENFSATNVVPDTLGTETLQTNGSLGSSLALNNCPAAAISSVINFCQAFSGSFTITTSVGTVSGSATGSYGFYATSAISLPGLLVGGELVFTVTSGTGQFAGTTGTLDVGFSLLPASQSFAGGVLAA